MSNLLTAANEIKRDLAEYDGATERLERLIRNASLLADAYTQSTRYVCWLCNELFSVEVVGLHCFRRGVMMCPNCGREPIKLEQK